MTYNKTTSYLAAMLEYPLNGFFKDCGFINCYLGDHSFPEVHQNCIYVRLKPKEITETVIRHLKEARTHKDYVRDYDLPYGEIMYVFKLDEKFENDIRMFKQGKYSKINREFVEKNFAKDSKRYKVLTKNSEYKNSLAELYRVNDNYIEELDSIPNPEKEIFRFNETVGW